MTTYIDFADAADSVASLAELMGDLDVGALPIGTAEAPLGVVTDRDILFRVVAKGLDPSTVTAAEIVSTPLHSCTPDTSLDDALEQMAANQLRRLAVREGDGPVVGWITLADISRRLLLESGAIGASLREVSAGSVA